MGYLPELVKQSGSRIRCKFGIPPILALCFNQTLYKTKEAQELAVLSLMSGTDYKGTSSSCSCQHSSSLTENYLTEGWFRKEL